MNHSEAELSGYKIRGLLYGAVCGWLIETYGFERFEDFLETLPPPLKERITKLEKNKFHPSDTKEWYPAHEVYPLYEQVADYLKSEMNEKQIIDELVNYMFKQSVSGFMKGLLSFLTPAALIRRSSTFWRRVHSSGEVTIKEKGKNLLSISLYDWKTHRISCMIFENWTRRLIELTGRTVVQMTKTHCCLEGDEACTWDVEFR